MSKKLLFLLLCAATVASAAAQGFDSRFFNNQFLSAGYGMTAYDHDAGTSKGRGMELSAGNWILKDIAVRLGFGMASSANALGYTSQFFDAHCDFLWDVEVAVNGKANPRRAFAFYPEVGFGFICRRSIETGSAQPMPLDPDFTAMAGAMVLVRFPGLTEWPLFAEARLFVLPQDYDFNHSLSYLGSLSFGVMREINYDPVHKRLPGESRDWTLDWFMGAAAGIDYSVMSYESSQITTASRIGWNADLTLGRNLSSLWTVRLALGTLSGTTEQTAAEGFEPVKQDYVFCNARADLMFNVSNISDSRNSRQFNLLPYAGCGLISRFDQPTLVMGADAGLMARWYVSRHTDFIADARYLMVPPRFNGGRHSFDNGFFTFNIGFLYNYDASCRHK